MTPKTPTRADVRTARAVLDALPDLVAARRAHLGHGLRAAAERIGLNYPDLSRYENRTITNPKLETIERLMDYVTNGRK